MSIASVPEPDLEPILPAESLQQQPEQPQARSLMSTADLVAAPAGWRPTFARHMPADWPLP